MSEENVEIVRRTYARWARGDMQAGVDLFDPEIVFESFTPDANERIVVTGPAKIAAFMEEFLGQWREYRSTCCSSPNRSRCIPETPDGSAHEAGTAAPEVMRRHPVETDKGRERRSRLVSWPGWRRRPRRRRRGWSGGRIWWRWWRRRSDRAQLRDVGTGSRTRPGRSGRR
jgi:hypothetical protein